MTLHLRDWRAKAALQRIFSVLPSGHRLNYLFQRHVTHGLPIGDAALDAHVDAARHHLRVATTIGNLDPGSAVFFEFGAGWDLCMPLALHQLGVDHQILVDIRPLARLDLVTDMAARLTSQLGRPCSAPSPHDLHQLLSARGISYRAPLDAMNTGFEAGSVQCITSTNTLEHILPATIQGIYAECHRVLDDDGVMSFEIDYQDHYSYFDPRISVYNYLCFDERRWRRYNPSLHFQNRLRHDDHVALIEAAGFEVVEEEVTEPDADDLALLATLDLDRSFTLADPRRVGIRGARLAMRKRR